MSLSVPSKGPSAPSLSKQAGLTMVELMVAVAINLVVVVIAAYLYLNGRSTQQAVEERTALFENGQLALELLGREIGNAGFYPADQQEPPAAGQPMRFLNGVYQNPQPATAAFNTGVFGCANQEWSNGQHQCVNHANGAAGDGLVLNYFTSDAFTLQSGSRADCQGTSAVEDSAINNAVRTGGNMANEGVPPAFPLFVSNRYTLRQFQYQINGVATQILGLACTSNASANYQVLVPGIDQFRVRYGVRDAAGARATQYLDAAAVGLLGGIIVDERTLTAWERVVSIEVCIVARSLTKTRFKGAGNEVRVGCDGQTLSGADGFQRQRFVQVFAVKNQLPDVVPVAAGGGA